jgi:atypical dual specificity phosphatase
MCEAAPFSPETMSESEPDEDPNLPVVVSCYGWGNPRLKAPSQIFDWLFLGTFEHARSQAMMEYLSISHVLDVENGGRKPDWLADERYMGRPMCDFGSTELPSMIDDATAFIHKVREAGDKILVHCEFGINRSTTAVVAYLVRYCDMSLRDALIFCLQRRAVVRPRTSYIAQLCKLERLWRPDRPEEEYLSLGELRAIFNETRDYE